MNERIKELRKTLGFTMEKFGDKIGIKKSAISLIESGKNKVTDANIKSICREFNVDYTWLTTGKGNMFQEKDEEVEARDFLDNIMNNYPNLKDAIAKFVSVTTTDDLEHLDDWIGRMLKVENDDISIYDEIPDTAAELERQYPVINDDSKNAG